MGNRITAQYAIKSVVRDTPDTVVLTFSALGGEKMEFYPGQFVMLKFPVSSELSNDGKAKDVKRAYSIGSSPLSSEIVLYVKEMPEGFVSKELQQVVVGVEFELSGPFGHFYFDEEKPEQQEIVLLGAGSGVAPFLSMVEYITAKGLGTKVNVFCSHKTEADIIGREIFERVAEQNGNVRLHFHCTRDKNWSGTCERISEGHLKNHLGGLDGMKKKTYFLCGPMAFVKAMKMLLISLGVDKGMIKQEVYG